MATEDTPVEQTTDCTNAELEALHEVELGLEWFQRAQGYLIEFHHATGHGMDHLHRAETLLKECDNDALADAIRDELLPRGVIDDERWSYDVLENFQDTLLAETVEFERRVRWELADGQRHAAERLQEREWKCRGGQW